MQGYMVYWTQVALDGIPYPYQKLFGMEEMMLALSFMELLRHEGQQFITMVSQNPEHVGKPGASTILPEDYAWSKQYRGSADQTKIKSLMGGRSQE